MYKRKSQAMQRYHRVQEIDRQPVGYVTQGDLLPDFPNMDLNSALDERARLIAEKSRDEQELLSAKRQRDHKGIEILGIRIAVYSKRLSLVNQHIKRLRRSDEDLAMKAAMNEVLDDDIIKRLIDHKNEIKAEMMAGTWGGWGMSKHNFTSEAELVRAYLSAIECYNRDGDWVAYPETGGFDLLMAQKSSGIQVGIEAKLSLNVKVLNQALTGTKNWCYGGPDYRAVLVPGGGVQNGLHDIALRLGITVLSPAERGWNGKASWWIHNGLPDEANPYELEKWYPWCPTDRVSLPDYVPDCIAGSPSPITLTDWKIKAIRAAILLDKQGYITRADIKNLGMDVSRWCNNSSWLTPEKRDGRFVQYTAGPGMPDFKAQHPRNYAEIEADYVVWFAELEKKRDKK